MIIHLKKMLARRMLRQGSAVNAPSIIQPVEATACPEFIEGPSLKTRTSADWKLLKLTLIAGLMLSCIGTAIATPLEDQAKLLYSALKGNRSTEAMYAYCTKHNISAEQIANETKKICEANNDWDTYSKATELEILWEDRMQSMSNVTKVMITIGAFATIITTYMLYKYLKKTVSNSAEATKDRQEIPPVVPPTPPVVDPAPPVVLPHPMPNQNPGAMPRPNPQDDIQVPMMAGHAQQLEALDPQAMNQIFAALGIDPQAQAAMERNPQMLLAALGNPQAQNFGQLLGDPALQQMLNTPDVAALLGQNDLLHGLQDLANNPNVANQFANQAWGNGAPQVNFQETVNNGVRTQTRTEDTVNDDGVRTRKTTTTKTYNF